MQYCIQDIRSDIFLVFLLLKDIQQAFGPDQRNYLEMMLRKYQRVVGEELSEEMVVTWVILTAHTAADLFVSIKFRGWELEVINTFQSWCILQ